MTRMLNFSNFRFLQAVLALLLLAVIPANGQNAVNNGDFEAGNTGFQTDYSYYGPPPYMTDGGVYHVKRNPHDFHPSGFYDCGDHTGNNGRFFFANGFGSSSTARVWSQTVNVQPNSYYSFTFWATHISWGQGQAYNRANFYVKINGTQIGSDFAPQAINGQANWCQFPPQPWYSGNLTQATITIYDRCAASTGWGDDFGIDDISLTYSYSNVVQATPDSYSTCFGRYVDFNPLDNDVITPSSLAPNVNFSVVSQPGNGSLQLLSGTNYRYTPNTGFVGTDSFTYRLTYGSGSNTITSTGTVTITVNARPQRIINQDACENYTWSYTGQTYYQSGQYQFVKVAPTACDSLLILNLTIYHGEEETLPAVEECEQYTWHGTTYTSSGTYDYQTTTDHGCIRIEHLPITIHHGDTVDLSVSACEHYTWHGQTYSSSGTYTHWTTNSFGCDRLERLILTISDRYHEVVNVEECEEYYWPRTHQMYHQSVADSVTVEGPQGGCDSTFVLNLVIHHGDTIDVEPVEACDSYVWHGTNYTTSGIKTFMTTNEFGCDRMERLNLTIHNSESIELPSVTACDEYVWHGRPYTESGVVVFDTVNQYGCNLQYVLPLTVNHSDTLDWDPVTECDSYLWYGQTINETGSYSHWSTNPQGCDRLERIFVTINHSTIDTLAPVSACDSYEWHGTNYSQSGTYVYEGVGPTGCPATEVLRLTIKQSSEFEFNVTSCEPYEWYGTVYDEPGIYHYALTNSQGCDSLLIMHLEMGDIYTREESVVGCESYEWYGEVYTQGGDYQHEVSNPNGCDSLFILHLTIAPTYADEFEAEACNAYTWIDETYTQSGDYERHFNSTLGCDSLVVMHLTILQPSYYEFEQQTCGEFTWNGVTYYDEGDYQQTFTGPNGCDSIATMHLVFREAMTSEFDRQSCAPIVWEGQLCDHNDDYQHTYESLQGCDSIVTMHFSLAESMVTYLDTLACSSFNWYGNSCDGDGEYIHTFETSQGCDSTVVMNLTLNVTQMYTQFVSACDSTKIGDTWYTEPGNYYVFLDTIQSYNGCDSIIHRVNLTIRNSEQMAQIEGSHEVYVASNLISGIYTYSIDTTGIIGSIDWSLTNPDWQVLDHDPVSCRILVTTPGTSYLTAHFNVADCGETERQFVINAGYFGVDDQQGIEAHVYPNPTKGMVTVEAAGIESIRVINMIGQTLEVLEGIDQDHYTLNLSAYGPSVYLLEIKTVNGMAKQRVVYCR